MGARRRLPGAFCLLVLLLIESSGAVQVTIPNPFNVVIMFQPVTLQCNFQTAATQPPIVVWKYKSYCRNRVTDALNPTSQDTQINNQLQANNPGYNPYVECQDSSRTVRVVATKQGSAITLGEFYQGRRITITNNADLSIEQTAWGDSGVYYCSVFSAQDLSGNNEAYAELIVLGSTSMASKLFPDILIGNREGSSPEVSELLPDFQIGNMEDWLFVVLVVLGGFIVFLLISICWCQCCPHTCCCYVRCPCCPEKCCCPRALYEAGKAATSGVPSIYAPSVYAPSVYSHSSKVQMGPPGALMPMAPVPSLYNGYGMDYDAASSVRSGYRIQANQQDDSMRVLYYMEKELANFDPARQGEVKGTYEKSTAMSEISSLHEEDQRNALRNGLGRLRNQAMTPIRDVEEESLLSIETRRTQPLRQDYAQDRYRGEGNYERRPRAHSMDNLDNLDRRNYDQPRDQRFNGQNRGRRYSDEENNYDYRRPRDYSPESRTDYYGGRRSRSRDDLRDLDRSRNNHGDYDDHFLEDVLRKKQQKAGNRDAAETASNSTSRSGARRNDDDFPPPPPPYTETESLSSRGKQEKKFKKSNPLSRDSLVV
ncbi:lipolysis-stimulated lipoprotein receptor isoform X2 [Ambystoma mexicanum]|uniref:lipolysis-stimulated lipoprotein receptor isoform X2 n=1 Tax=Ambystoma mexicanum TaxID=8296 RepID=UPI0037E7CE23